MAKFITVHYAMKGSKKRRVCINTEDVVKIEALRTEDAAQGRGRAEITMP